MTTLKITCKCKAEGTGISFRDYGLCEECLAIELQTTRALKVCFHCGGEIRRLDERHLFCPRCGLVLARFSVDRLRAGDDQKWPFHPEEENWDLLHESLRASR